LSGDIILHHYPQSPVSEKVRCVLGIKDLSWRSVIIPRMPPKPDLVELTGGYRLTPVMQIGADIFCDTQAIIRELERIKPEPTLFPGGSHGMAWAVGRWTDVELFKTVTKVVFGDAGKDLPKDFSKDRGALYFGADYNLKALIKALPENLVQLRAQIEWIDERLAARDFMLGAEPGLPDALCYYNIWFIRGRYSKGPAFLKKFKRLCAWENRVKAIGHGRPKDMDASYAHAVARGATSLVTQGGDGDDLCGINPGDEVTVESTGVTGCPAVQGRTLRISSQEIVIQRHGGIVGNVAVHFPRAGYLVKKV